MQHDCGVSPCGRPTQERICEHHLGELVGALRDLVEQPADLLTELETTATRQDRLGSPVGVRTRGGGEKPVFFLEPASALLADVRDELAWWGRYCAERFPHFQAQERGPREAAVWLLSIPRLLAGMEGVESMHGRVTHLTRQVWRQVDARPRHVHLGVCSTQLPDEGECPKHLYAPIDDRDATPAWMRCPACGADHDVRARQRTLVAQARVTGGTAAEVSRVLARVGVPVPASTVRSWAQHRVSRGTVIEPRIEAVDVDVDGHPIYRVLDVLSVWMSGQAKRGRAA